MSSNRNKIIIEKLKQLQPSFIIGTAASAHQVEGNTENDWTHFEQYPGNIANNHKSGQATNHYELFDHDFEILNELGFKAHRLSIEWSRIFPSPNVIDHNEIKHYREVLKSMKKNEQISFVTLHHFTSPRWFIDIGGFKEKKNLVHWEEFVTVVCEELGDLIDVFNTINEPFIYCATGYLQGVHAPGEKGLIKYMKVGNNIMRAHFYAVDIIRKICPGTPAGIVKNLIHFNSKPGINPINKIIRYFSDWGYNLQPMKSLKNQKIPFGFRSIDRGDTGDFVGINYYVNLTVGLGLPDFMQSYSEDDTRLTQMGWGVNPDGMIEEIKRFSEKIDLPIFITENGIATDDDNWRLDYVYDHLEAIISLLEEGIDIRGYFYWSNIDNFEWSEGFAPTFGLISYDPETFEREVKESGEILGQLADELWVDRRLIRFD